MAVKPILDSIPEQTVATDTEILATAAQFGKDWTLRDVD
jgi:hypothetical protein